MTSYLGCRVSVLADTAADAACQLDDVVQVAGWPETAGCAVDDALEGIDVLAVALARLGPEAEQLLAPVWAATISLREHLGLPTAADDAPAATTVEEAEETLRCALVHEGCDIESVADGTAEPETEQAVTPPASAAPKGEPPVLPVQRAKRTSRRGLGPVGRDVLAEMPSSKGRRSGQPTR
ncbi:hypothetical protein [Streptomyces sp. NPDC051561]|uniref:hypothetical protein n=1 Tax=Streptomyces sp. NPDC051561 TaxID=3365658 RepID=UPI003788CC09